MDDQQRAREFIPADTIGNAYEFMGEEKVLAVSVAVDAINAALRAAPEAVALRTAMRTLEQIASTPRNKGARVSAMATLQFLQTQLAARPQGVK